MCISQISIGEVLLNFPKTLLGPKLWIIYAATDVPTIGKIMKEVTNNDLFGNQFDTTYQERAQKTL